MESMVKATRLALVQTPAVGLQAITVASKSAQLATTSAKARRVTAENSSRQRRRTGSPSQVVQTASGLNEVR